jgi:hypothetical protein
MGRPRVRFTVRTMMIAMAVVALLLVWTFDRSARRERCYEIAARHANLSAEYRRNANGNGGMLRIAAWHDHMRRMFENTADRPWEPIPASSPFPPPTWRGSTITVPTD